MPDYDSTTDPDFLVLALNPDDGRFEWMGTGKANAIEEIADMAKEGEFVYVLPVHKYWCPKPYKVVD